jgi:hypothetical protein
MKQNPPDGASGGMKKSVEFKIQQNAIFFTKNYRNFYITTL